MMQIAHTSDWHAGRIWKQVPRLAELAEVLANLADDLEREKVDLLLMSGDVFDTGSPRPDAERAGVRFLQADGQAGIPTVVIAGNHDSAARLGLGAADRARRRARGGRPCPADRGGLQAIATRSGETALVAAVPFASPGDLVSALDLAQNDTAQAALCRRHARHRDERDRGLSASDAREPAHAAHPPRGGVVLGLRAVGAPRRRVGSHAQALPATAHYIALGHIHKPQRVSAAPSPAFYAGSPLQMDFGESGEDKSWVLVDARAGQPVRCERVPYRGGRVLERVRATLPDLERDAPRLLARGYLWVTVPLAAPEPDLNSRVRRLLPNAVKVEPELPERERTAAEPRPARTAPAEEIYAAYHARTHGAPPPAELLEAFRALHTAAEEVR